LGGDQLVPALVGCETDEEQGDRIRDTRDELYRELIGEVEPLECARKLIVDLKERGFAAGGPRAGGCVDDERRCRGHEAGTR
jgi:hypothetical protein